jgi:hypothetical protein
VVPPCNSGGAIDTDIIWTGRRASPAASPSRPSGGGNTSYFISIFSFLYAFILSFYIVTLYCIVLYLLIDRLHRKLTSAEPQFGTIGNLQ